MTLCNVNGIDGAKKFYITVQFLAIKGLILMNNSSQQKGAGSFHIHCKTMKEFGTVAVQERPHFALKKEL